MTFPFDLSASVAAIAALEDAITTPSPGVVTAYGFGANPAEITNPALLPAVVHLSLGPATVGGEADTPGRLTFARHRLRFDVASIMLVAEAVPDAYPADEQAGSLFWKPICETFFNKTNIATLVTASGAASYACILDDPCYAVRAWPPAPAEPLHYYYTYRYIHRFTFMESA